jgi:hypothetical protein
MATTKFNRRDFTKLTFLAGAGISLIPSACKTTSTYMYSNDNLLNLSEKLLEEWCDSLISYQITNLNSKGLYGGIICPACARIHGRIGDTIYPMMHMAAKTGNKKYLNAAKLLFDWVENNVSSDDGSIVNDVNVSDWKGITVNWIISLTEALRHHGHLLDEKTKQQWIERIRKGIDFVFGFISFNISNINYPLVTSYAMLLTGELFNDQKLKDRAREYAHIGLNYITEKDKILFGEGVPLRVKSPKGCYSVDLGYNMEETLPYLVMYALHAKDDVVLEAVTASMRAHLQFYLPDGALDNSFGTRNFKWTYWGTRTGDGMQPAFLMLADKEPAFYKAAYLNTLLLKNCTHNGLLHGGPHYVSRDIPACIQHTFCHTKALATILDFGITENQFDLKTLTLPREEEKGVAEFTDVQTWLISKGEWRATITGYDRENNSTHEGHATGGALSVLWSKAHGPVMIASTTRYQMHEAANMQLDLDLHSIPLTPRLEYINENNYYRNINDLKAKVEWHTDGDVLVFDCFASLVDGLQQNPASGIMTSHIQYRFSDREVSIKIMTDQNIDGLNYIFPVVSTNDEKIDNTSSNTMLVHKKAGDLKIVSSTEIKTLATSNGRVFNFVPGMEAIPLAVSVAKETSISITLQAK